MVSGPSPGPAPAAQARGQQLPAHPVQLADVAPPETAQEGSQGGGSLDRAAENPGGPARAQHVGIDDAVAADQRGGHQRHQLVAAVGPSRGIAQIQVAVGQCGQAETVGESGGKEQPGIGHQAGVVKGDLDPVRVVVWQHLLGAPCFGLVCCSKTIIPDTQEHLLAPSGNPAHIVLRWIRA